eukprot:922767-Prorocentrum_minimum.AAC.1
MSSPLLPPAGAPPPPARSGPAQGEPAQGVVGPGEGGTGACPRGRFGGPKGQCAGQAQVNRRSFVSRIFQRGRFAGPEVDD